MIESGHDRGMIGACVPIHHAPIESGHESGHANRGMNRGMRGCPDWHAPIAGCCIDYVSTDVQENLCLTALNHAHLNYNTMYRYSRQATTDDFALCLG